MTRTQTLPLVWRKVSRWHSDTVKAAIEHWEGTPYVLGSQAPGRSGGTDCVRFMAAVLDRLFWKRTAIETLPQDQALHDRAGAIAAMLSIRKLYMPNRVVRDGTLEPGDVLVLGPRNGGPGHVMIAGADRFLWHAEGPGGEVVRTGLSSPLKLFRVYRASSIISSKWGRTEANG